ncbi:hypothetical protein [Streptomyces scopuliridis]|uniref:hypothetical protein n=1 Tax=Streptomyces scopuliridis TaxID=452529 RepID=UPI001F0C3B0D|nr:hypothetical protein [Streptomyces scopuliridis]
MNGIEGNGVTVKMRELGRTGIQVSPYRLGAIVGPRTMEHLEDLLSGAATTLDGEVLDRIDRIVAPGTGLGPLDVSYTPPALRRAAPRRRPADQRAAGVTR